MNLKNIPENNKYNIEIRKKIISIVLIFIALIGLLIYSTVTGAIKLNLLDILFNESKNMESLVLMDIRLPRVITAVVVGMILATSGAIMQCVLENPLASASTLGVSQGSAFGAAIGILVFGGGVVHSSTKVLINIENMYIVSLCAFIFGFLTTVVILLISQIKKDLGSGGMILAGVALASLFAGGSTLLQYFANETELSAIVFWTFGNLGGTNWNQILILFVVFLVSFIYFMINRWDYNAMNMGGETAKSLGVNARVKMLWSMAVSTFTVAISVSFVGPINFIGLIAPHMMRKFVGDDYRYLIPASALAGALVLLAADTFARLIISPVILPVGAITSFLGAPAFLFLLLKGGKNDRS